MAGRIACSRQTTWFASSEGSRLVQERLVTGAGYRAFAETDDGAVVRSYPQFGAGLYQTGGWERGGRLGRTLAKAAGLLAAAAPESHLKVARIYLWTALSWSLKFLAFATLLRHFLPVDLWRALVGVMGAELSSVLPFHGIAGSGSYELAAVAAMVPAGVDPAAALAGAVNLHLFVLGVTLLLGGLALLLPKGGPGGFARRDPG